MKTSLQTSNGISVVSPWPKIETVLREADKVAAANPGWEVTVRLVDRTAELGRQTPNPLKSKSRKRLSRRCLR